jgi:predicted phage terminase large subunit-like protein
MATSSSQSAPSGSGVLNAKLIEAFALMYMQKGFDDAKPTPEFHREGWRLYSSAVEKACVIAPRGHAKSSALTHVYVLASMLFRAESYAILISTNEELAIEHLGDITRELTENEEMIKDFEVSKFVTLSKTEIIVEFLDGHQFRILARGSGQKLRGRKWRGMRPGLIVCDDLEDDEQVENKDRRDKFRRWFNRAAIPALRRGGKIRVHGTILHEDSLLARLRKNKEWQVRYYRAHKNFDDFSEILWPEQFTEEALRGIRQRYIEDFDANGYSQEYLNDPFDNAEAYLKKEWFLQMREEDFEVESKISVGVDFAVSKADKANRTSLTIGGSPADNRLLIVGQRVGRWGIDEVIDEMFVVQETYSPSAFYVEDGVIWKAIEPILNREMATRNVWLMCIPLSSAKDKAVRGRSLQKRMKAGNVFFDKDAPWYAPYESELLRFTGYSEARLDDQFDSTAILARGLDTAPILDEDDFTTDEELSFREQARQAQSITDGRSDITGY